VANYTRGPLKTHSWTSHGLVIATESGTYLGYAQGYPRPEPHQVSESVAAANGQLWAVSPDLFAELEAELESLNEWLHHEELSDELKSAMLLREDKISTLLRRAETAVTRA
jgi:hypothetical protein